MSHVGEELVARDDPGHVAIPNWIVMHPDLKGNDVRVWAALAHLIWYFRNLGSPTADDIATVAQVGERTVWRCIDRLVDVGAVRVTPGDTKGTGKVPNIYELVRDRDGLNHSENRSAKMAGRVGTDLPKWQVQGSAKMADPLSIETEDKLAGDSSTKTPDPGILEAVVQETIDLRIDQGVTVVLREQYAKPLYSDPAIIEEALRRTEAAQPANPAKCLHLGYEPGETCRVCESVLTG